MWFKTDVDRVIIAGPGGTPYENELFEFGLWCAEQFPFASPKVFFRGTQGGQLWINPNLHADGKGELLVRLRRSDVLILGQYASPSSVPFPAKSGL
jgi:hypothetical protein